MTWSHDGSGLAVKRVRGKTIPQLSLAIGVHHLAYALGVWAARRRMRREKRAFRENKQWLRRYVRYPDRHPNRRTRRAGQRRWLEMKALEFNVRSLPGEFSAALRERVMAAIDPFRAALARGRIVPMSADKRRFLEDIERKSTGGLPFEDIMVRKREETI